MYHATTRVVDGIEAAVVDVGSGPPVVLWHSGEYGASSQTSWRHLVPALAASGYRAIAVDWLGFGESAKVVDFADPSGFRLRHMMAVLRELRVENAAYVGSSMGATALAKALAAGADFPARVAVLASGGGFIPDNEARRTIQEYDLSVAGMQRILATMTFGTRLSGDEKYVAWRHELSLIPGAWQCAASARLRPPVPESLESDSGFGRPDTIAYERISCPTLVVAGADDPLRLPRYANELAARIPDSSLLVYPDCGHLPNIEQPERFAADVITFLDRRYRSLN